MQDFQLCLGDGTVKATHPSLRVDVIIIIIGAGLGRGLTSSMAFETLACSSLPIDPIGLLAGLVDQMMVPIRFFSAGSIPALPQLMAVVLAPTP